MPIINVKLIEGRTVEQKRAMVKAVTQAVSETLGVAESAIRICIEDMKPENFAQGGELRLDRK